MPRDLFQRPAGDSPASLVHLTRSQDGDSALEVLLQILASREVRASRNHSLFAGALPYLPPAVQRRFNVACFREWSLQSLGDPGSPLADGALPVEPYGLAVRKDQVVAQQGNPVLYVASFACQNFLEVWDQLVAGENWDVLASIMPFVSIIKEGNDFHWEREWRVPGGLPIAPDSVPFIVCPEEEIDRLQHELYLSGDDDWAAVPMVDAAWDQERIAREIAAR